MPELIPPSAALSFVVEPSLISGLRVLVVEDEYVMAQGLRHELELRGAVVLGPVPSVASALALLAAGSPPDAAILDLSLDGEMAFPVAEALQAQGVPFVFATGFDAWSIPRAFMDVPYCVKPMDVERCLRALLSEAST